MISNTASVATYTGNGSQQIFEVKDGSEGIYFEAASELYVTLRTGATVSVKSLGTHYTVSGAGSDAGYITFLTAPPNGYEVRIERRTPLTQTLDLTSGGAFNPSNVTSAFDKLTRALQDQSRGGSGGEASGTYDGDPLTKDPGGTYWDGEDLIARGFADGVEDDDLVTKAQLDAVEGAVADEVAAAAASASAASSSASTASTAASTATTAAATATTQAGLAATSATAASGYADDAAASAAAAEAAANGEITAYTILGNNTASTAAASALSVANVKTLLGYTKTDISLGNVDNTSDANKPVSTATQTALDLKAPLASPTLTGTAAMADATISGTLSVTGGTTLSGGLALTGGLSGTSSLRAGSGSPIFWSSRAQFLSPADGQINARNYANTAYATVGVATPTSAEHAARKDYVDTAVAGVSSEWVEIGDTTISSAVANVEHTWTAGTYAMVLVIISDLSCSATNPATLNIGLRNSTTSIVAATLDTSTDVAAAVQTGVVEFVIGLDAATMRSVGVPRYSSGTTSSSLTAFGGTNATAADRVRISYATGNIDDGRIIVKGLKA